MPRPKTLKPIRPSSAIEARYRQRLDRLIDEMHRSLVHWVCLAYKRNPPALAKLVAQDASPAATMRAILRALSRRWQRRFNHAADDLADYFATASSKRSDVALQSILRESGVSVRFRTTRAINDVLQATVNENVSLIRSIAQQHLAQVEQMVMRSVQSGRDLQQLQNDLQRTFGVTKRRAALIARDQNNKATSVIQRTRQAELGITEAVWVHSGAGREPRPSHIKAGKDRVRYDIREGWFDPHEGRNIFPGELINCRCVSRPVIPGFS